MRTGIAVLVCACATLAAPAAASAHARSATVALDYQLVLDRAAASIPRVHVAILDGDRSLRIATAGPPVVVLGDLGERMLRIERDGVFANRHSVTAVAEKLTSAGAGWARIGSGGSFTWHEHRLAPPPWGARTGPVARFSIPVLVGGRRAVVGGTFVRHARPALWPWLAAAALFAAAVALAVHARLRIATPLGAVAGVLGAAAAAVSLGSLGVFRHGVVVSALPAAVSRAVLEVAFLAGVGAAAASLRTEGRR